MNDNHRWPRMGQAATSRAVETIARHAAWGLVECDAYHGLPLAAFLKEEARALLVGVTDAMLLQAMGIMNEALLDNRSDGVIVGRCDDTHGLPRVALGLWRPGAVAWHQPLVPWLTLEEVMWLVPDDTGPSACAYELAAKRIAGRGAPWMTREERWAGLRRAATAFDRRDEEDG